MSPSGNSSSSTTLSIGILANLPHDALRKAFSCLNAKDLASLALTNKFFKLLSEEIVQDILREIQQSLFPVLFDSKVTNVFKASAGVNMKRLLHRLTTTQVYTLGGAFNADQVNCYLPKNNSWFMGAEMLQERENSCVATVRGYVVALSGESDDSTSHVEIFSPLENTWSQLPCMPTKIRSTACVTMGDRVVVIGGQDTHNGQEVSTIHTLDLQFGQIKRTSKEFKSSELQWKVNEDILLESRSAHAAVVYKNQIWIAGGSTATEFHSNTVETLSMKADGSFTSSTSMPAMNKARRNFSLLVVKGRLYAVGGDDEASIEAFNVDTEEWEMVADFPSYKTNFAATTDGEHIFVFGGQDMRKRFLTSWECYNVESDSWTVTKGKIPAYDAGFSHGCAVTMDFENVTW